MIKKLGLVVLIFALIIVAAAVVLPLVFDVDKYRPEITQKVNDRMNGKLELGKLKLSLWGQIRVDIAGLKLTDADNRPLLSVSDAFLHLPFRSLLKGSPEIVLKMNRPAVSLIKDKAGKLNAMNLMKTAESAPPSDPAGAPAAPSEPIAVPGIAARSTAGIELRNAQVTYKDEVSGTESSASDINLVARNLSLSKPTELSVWGNLDTKLANQITVRGPAKIEAKLTPRLVDRQFDAARVTAEVDLNQLEIMIPGMLEKRAGVRTSASIDAEISRQAATIQNFVVWFHNAEIKIQGGVNTPATPIVDLRIESNSIDLRPWNELVPLARSYELGGSASFYAEASGPASSLQYKGSLKVEALTAKAPMLKSQPRIDGTLDVITDQIEKFNFTMSAPGNDVRLQGKVLSFSKPKATLELTSSSLDLDQLVEFPKEEAPLPTQSPAPSASPQPVTAPGKSAMLGAIALDASANLKSVKYAGVVMENIVAKLAMREGIATLDPFTLNLWDGSVKANSRFDLRTTVPTYQFGAKALEINLRKAVAAKYGFFKNTVLGVASFSMDGSGSSFDPQIAKSELNAKGNMKVVKASFATIDVGKMASDALNQSIDRIAQKYPQLKGKRVGVPPGRESRYDLISSDFTIANGKFTAPNFIAKAEPNQGIDVRGKTVFGILDYSIDSTWTLVDTYNITRAGSLDIEVAGQKVDHILGNPVEFPVSVGCTLEKPCYSYTQVPEALAAVALDNISKSLQGKAKAEVRKKAEDLLEKAPPNVKKGIEDIRKKLFK